MNTLDALNMQIDLYQYHKRDAVRMLRLAEQAEKTIADLNYRPTTTVFTTTQKVATAMKNSRQYTRAAKTGSLAERSLEHAQTVFVADWVVDALQDAVHTFPEEYEPHLVDMPFDNGFARLGREISLNTRPLWGIEVQAISWHRSGSEILVCLYGTAIEVEGHNAPKGGVQAPEVKSCVSMWLGESIAQQAVDRTPETDDTWFSVVGDRFEEHKEDPAILQGLVESETRWTMRFLCSLWLFMGEKLTAMQSEYAPRQVRRQMVRDGIPFEPKVQTIVLRSTHYEGRRFEEGHGRELTVRFSVRGHWHRFWVGKKDGSEERRLVPRWLDPYVKGPDDAPFVGPMKLFAVTK